jgi:hypothetical protein
MTGALALGYAGLAALPLAMHLALAVLFWPAVAVTILSLLANAASPSRPERRLWTPVLASMAVAAFGVAFL